MYSAVVLNLEFGCSESSFSTALPAIKTSESTITGIKQVWELLKTPSHVDADAHVMWYKVIHVISPNFMQ